MCLIVQGVLAGKSSLVSILIMITNDGPRVKIENKTNFSNKIVDNKLAVKIKVRVKIIFLLHKLFVKLLFNFFHFFFNFLEINYKFFNAIT